MIKGASHAGGRAEIKSSTFAAMIHPTKSSSARLYGALKIMCQMKVSGENISLRLVCAFILPAIFMVPATAEADLAGQVSACRLLRDDQARLSCYDQLVPQPQTAVSKNDAEREQEDDNWKNLTLHSCDRPDTNWSKLPKSLREGCDKLLTFELGVGIQPTKAIFGKCLLEISGEIYINGRCKIIQKEAFLVLGTKDWFGDKDRAIIEYNNSKSVRDTAYWNFKELGELYHKGACWTNTQTKICTYK